MNSDQPTGALIQDRTGDPSHATPVPADQRLSKILDVCRTIVLSLATLLTAWCGYQSTRWSGEMTIEFGKANALRLQSTGLMITGIQAVQVDLSLFEEWMRANTANDKQMMAYYERIFSSEFRGAFDSWIAARAKSPDKTPPTPFDMPEYKSAALKVADDISKAAELHNTTGLTANQTGDSYVLLTVILAMSMFLAGIAEHFRTIPLRASLTALSLIMLLTGVFTALSYPVA